MNEHIDTVPMPLPGPVPVRAPDEPVGTTPWARPAQERRLDLRFLGSGSEYFRIWIVNLLLTVLSLGLYYPYARARRLRYFHAATELDGHPLAFHGQASAMWRGYLLVMLLFMAYAAAGQYSAAAGAVALLLLAGLWPALWHASLRFRLANTGWRGLRAGFTGSRAGAYAALAPLVLMALLFAGSGALLPEDPQAEDLPRLRLLGMGWLLCLLLSLALLPWAVWRLKRYQHGHYTYAGEQTQLSWRLRSVFAVYGAIALLLLGLALLAGLLLSGLPTQPTGASGQEVPTRAFILILPLALMLTLTYTLLPAYHSARLQNLVWSHTHSARLRFHSALSFRALAWLTLKNALLVALSLGLYLPFAAVATARLRLEAVTVYCSVPPDELVSDGQVLQESAAGDAAGDVMGVDLGL